MRVKVDLNDPNTFPKKFINKNYWMQPNTTINTSRQAPQAPVMKGW
jgi:hypothetical protein